ncbi:MAG: hypothetical protein ACU0CF_04705 [Sagittula sp.]|uniref:hypothetical protein n=1 Tax=Sagittula sp. TaxID=2038081 RepID=UPI004057D0FC
MKIKITKRGVYGAAGEIPVGTEVDVKEEPKAWAGRYEVISGAKTKAAVTNPKKGAVQDIDTDRQAIMAEAAKVLKKDEFVADGRPDVHALNAMLGENVEKFTAEERDALWPGIADDVKAARG